MKFGKQKTIPTTQSVVEITTSEVPLLISSTKGSIFSVTFVKKDNTLRKLNGRTGVKSYLKGGHDTTSHISYYVNIFDIHKKEYRKVNMNTVTELHINHIKYVVIADDRNHSNDSYNSL